MGGNEFATTWWAKRWLAQFEDFVQETYLQRMQDYLWEETVSQIEIMPGWVYARVQGNGHKFYRVVIRLEKLSQTLWERLDATLAGDTELCESLLAWVLPHRLEDLLSRLDIPLFPRIPDEFIADCSCPDRASFCKHTAAVYYQLAREFDQDPLLLFLLRGKNREKLIADLNGYVQGASQPDSQYAGRSSSSLEVGEGYWKAKGSLEELRFNYRAADRQMLLLKALGPPPFWNEKTDFAVEIAALLKPLRSK